MAGNKIISPKQFLKGLLILLLVPVVVLALLAAYVYWSNSRPQASRLQTRVAPQVVLPGGEAAYYMTFTGEEKAAQPATVDIAFLIDVSGSMTSSLPAMSEAAYNVARELSSEKGRIRFALIRFDTDAEITTPWTDDAEVLRNGLQQLNSFTGQNDSRKALVKLSELFDNARPEAKKAAVFYTDGNLEACNNFFVCPFGPMTNKEMIDKAAELRAEKIELFSIGLPGHGSAPLMVEMTDSPSHVFDPVDIADLAANFRRAATSLIAGSEDGGQLSHRVDGRHFSVPLQGTSWGVDRQGSLTLSVGKLPKTNTTFAHPLVPLSAGLWNVGVEPPRLTFATQDGRLLNLQAERRPLVLVITWMMLLWWLLPATLWTLVYLTQRQPEVVRPVPPDPEISRPRPPSLLPTLPAVTNNRLAPVPTLFIGLGGAGLRSLQAARAELKQAHLGQPSQPYKFLWIDLDVKEAEAPTAFDEWFQFPIEQVVAPAEIRRAQAYLPELGKTPEHLRWFDVQQYINVPRENLNLTEGTRGDRALGRLALFQWLLQKDGLFAVLEGACGELVQMDSVDGTRQIVVFASPDGGTGSGWFLDIGRLLNRITRQQQERSEVEFVPEIIGLLSDLPARQNAATRRALEVEFGSARLAGAFPQRTTYDPNHDLLDCVDKESPYNWVFTTSAYDDDSVAAQAAELAAVMVERHPRTSLLKAGDELRSPQFISAQTRAVHVLPVQLYEKIQSEVFLRTVGPKVLLDLEASIEGGYSLKTVNEDRAQSLLHHWARSEPVSTPLQLLLAAASDSSLAPGFMRVMKEGSPPAAEWFVDALANSISLRLHGHRDVDDSEWHRYWMPGEAIATLRLLSTRLQKIVLPEMQAMGAPAATVEIVARVNEVATAITAQLETWTDEFCAACEKSHRRHSDSNQASDEKRVLSDRTYLDPLLEPEVVNRWIKEIFEAWLHTPDVTSAIRERLFFAVVPKGGTTRVVLRSYVDHPQEFETAEAAINTLDEQARVLACIAPAIRIGGALAKEPQHRRLKLANNMVDVTTAPREVLVVAPVTEESVEAQTVGEFCKSVPQPLSHGKRRDQLGNDQTALRRVELTGKAITNGMNGSQAHHVTIAEQQAELLRQRAENKHKIAVSTFPPELRIALSHPVAFASFVRAYKAGHIVLQKDAAGADQWSYSDTGEFLTSGSEPTLAQAAATYAWYLPSPPVQFERIGEGGSFTKLTQWQKTRSSADDDTLTLIAIDAYDDEEVLR
jgi:Mg-chelatase subunit ChlD